LQTMISPHIVQVIPYDFQESTSIKNCDRHLLWLPYFIIIIAQSQILCMFIMEDNHIKCLLIIACSLYCCCFCFFFYGRTICNLFTWHNKIRIRNKKKNIKSIWQLKTCSGHWTKKVRNVTTATTTSKKDSQSVKQTTTTTQIHILFLPPFRRGAHK